MKRKFIGVLLALAMFTGLLPQTVYAAPAALPTVISGTVIYANGTALIIAEEGSGTTVYIDNNRDGVLDAGELSLADSGITDAPANGADLSAWKIYGGYESSALDGDTKITMTGGSVGAIYGGGGDRGSTAVNTNVLVSGGTVGGVTVGSVYGSGNAGNVTGTANVTISDTANITGDVYGGGDDSLSTTNATMVKISGGKVSGSVYGGGSVNIVTTANVDISGGKVEGNVYGGGYNGAVTTANITISGGIVGDDGIDDYVYAGGHNSSASVVDATISMTGGTVGDIRVDGIQSVVTGNVVVTVTGGTVLKSVATYTPSATSRSLTVGGNAKIGNAAQTSGIAIHGSGENGIETFKIEPDLTADAKVYLRGPYLSSVLTAGETVATDAVASDAQYIEVSNNQNNLGAYFDAATNEIKLGTKPAITLHPEQEVTYVHNATQQTPLEVATSTAGATFQWYSNTQNSNTGGTPIPAPTGQQYHYTPPVTTRGTTYYYCVITDPTTGLSTPTNTSKVDVEALSIIDGSGRQVVRGQAHQFTSNDAFSIQNETSPIRVLCGDREIPFIYYTKRPGSIIVTLSSAYTSTMPLGANTLSIESVNGTATTTINVVDAPTSSTTTTTTTYNPAISPQTGVYN